MTSKQEECFERITGMLTSSTSIMFGDILVFLTRFHPDYMNSWIKGFVEESVDMRSCQAGALERSVTGLRGIDDAPLNKLSILVTSLTSQSEISP